MISAQGFRNVIWIISVFVGPVMAYFLTRALGGISWICRELHLCKVKLLVFFALGFVGVWAVYWTCYLLARALGKKRGKFTPDTPT